MARGFKAMQQAVKNISGGRSGGGRRFSYFNLEDGQSMIVRFLTDAEIGDAIVTCDFYEYVQTKMADKDGNITEGTNSFIVAPSYYAEDPTWKGEDWVLKYGGKTKEYGSQEYTTPRPKERSVAIAVEREAVPVDTGGGRPKFKYQDKLVEVTYKDKDGNEKTATGRNFILIRKDAKTFWGNVTGYFSEFGTLLDRDYKITRNGKQLATNYTCMPVGPEEEWDDPEELVRRVQGRYGYGGKDADGNPVDTEGEERFLWCPMTLTEWCEDQANEERIKALLTGQRSSGGSSNGSGGGPAKLDDPAGDAPPWAVGEDEAQTTAAPAPRDAEVSALRARLEEFK